MTKSPQDMIRSSLFAAVVTDPNLPDNPIIDCNRAFLELTGYDREEVLGRNCRFLAGPETEPEKKSELRNAIAERRTTIVQITNYRKDGSQFINALMIAPVFGDSGQLLAFLGSQAEVSHETNSLDENDRQPARELVQSLTRRQRQVLVMMAEGKMMKEIAYELKLNERTVKMHRSAALKSLGVQTSVGAIRIAILAGY